ncbi:MAG: hypothetical protein JWQ71_786, partial [Pedosphaera sp.]|nr:hypothetical protein [Pedosphaera sp.]
HSLWSVWFWIFFGLTLVLIASGVHDIWKGLRTYHWKPVACEITRSEAETRSDGYFIFVVSYHYKFRGKDYISDVRTPGTNLAHSDLAPVQQLILQYPRGSKTTCYVNPGNPSEAVLNPGAHYTILIIIPFPMFIWAVYERQALGEWLARRKRKRSNFDPGPASENRQLKRLNKKVLFIGFMGLLMGIGFSFMVWLQPLRNFNKSSHWQQTSCTILSSGIRTETHHQGQSFHPEVVFLYQVAGQEYKSSRLDFSSGLDASYSDAEKIVSAFPVGLKTVCYFNPANPQEAVLRRSFHVEWFFALFAAGMFAIGILLISTALGGVLGWHGQPRHFTGISPKNVRGFDPQKLRPEKPVGFYLAGSVVLAITCSLLAAALLPKSAKSLQSGHLDLIYVLYGLGAAFGIFYFLRQAKKFLSASLNPPPVFKLNPGFLTLGEPAELEWTFGRKASKLQKWHILLEGREEAQVMVVVPSLHGGTKDEKTQKRTFLRMPLAEVEADADRLTGLIKFQVPANTMHSFEGRKSKIIWSLQVESWLANGEMVEHNFKVFIRPNPGVAQL